jgi:hypothetical protein
MPDSEEQVLEAESAEGQQPLPEVENVPESGARQQTVPEAGDAPESGTVVETAPETENPPQIEDETPASPEAESAPQEAVDQPAAADAESAPASADTVPANAESAPSIVETGQGSPEPAAPKQDPPSVESSEERKSAPEYDIVPSKRLEPESNFVQEHYRPIAEALAAQGQNGSGKKPDSKAALSDISIERIRKFASGPTKVYAAIGVGMGLLVGLCVAVLFLHPGTASAPSDMGAVNSVQYGLKGQLTTNWTTKLEYRLKLEPIGPGQQAAFVSDVNSSPRPLSFTLQMKDPFGAVLCSNKILLKFDPKNAPSDLLVDAGPKASKAQQALAARNQIQQSINLARLEGEELDREHGKDIFQEDTGPDGQLASISSVGSLPCTQKQSDRIASWGFSTDFPVVARLAAADQSSSPDANANGDSKPAAEAPGKSEAAASAQAAAKAKRKPALPEPPVYIEGDDAIVYIDGISGMVETSAGKTLMLDKTDPVLAELRGRDIPISIHYRCDQTGACTFAAIGTGIHRARLKR